MYTTKDSNKEEYFFLTELHIAHSNENS